MVTFCVDWRGVRVAARAVEARKRAVMYMMGNRRVSTSGVNQNFCLIVVLYMYVTERSRVGPLDFIFTCDRSLDLDTEDV
jgi:hypothetical protein